jgi:hypothetical protein
LLLLSGNCLKGWKTANVQAVAGLRQNVFFEEQGRNDKGIIIKMAYNIHNGTQSAICCKSEYSYNGTGFMD